MPLKPESMFGVAVDGWRLGIGAIFALPRLFASAFLLVAACYFLLYHLETGSASTALTLTDRVLDVACRILSTFVVASVLIGVHRFVLLEEQADRFVWIVPQTYLRFALSLVVVDCYEVPLILLASILGSELKVSLVVINAAYTIVAVVVGLRLILLFPALAVGSPFATWSNSWRDTRGHVWRLLGTFVLVGIPMVLVVAVIVAVSVTIAVITTKQGGHMPLWPGLVLVPSLMVAISVPSAAMGAVIASRYFQAYGNALTSPPTAEA